MNILIFAFCMLAAGASASFPHRCIPVLDAEWQEVADDAEAEE